MSDIGRVFRPGALFVYPLVAAPAGMTQTDGVVEDACANC